LLIKNTAIFEIILLVSLSFAIAFILEENLASANGNENLQNGGHSGASPPVTTVPVGTSAPTTSAKILGYELPAIGSGATSFFTAHLIEGVFWGGVLALGIKYLGPMLGLSEEASNAATLTAFLE